MRAFFILSAVLCLSAFAAWEDTVSEHPSAWECVASETRLERGLDLTQVITLRESAAHLPEVSAEDLEEVWDWHPIGQPEPPPVSPPTAYVDGYRGASSSGSSHAWHNGHGNYPKGANTRVVSGGDMPRGVTSIPASSEKSPKDSVAGSHRYPSSFRGSQEGRGRSTSSSKHRGHRFEKSDFLFGTYLVLVIFAVIVLPLYLKISEKGPQYLFHWGFHLGLPSLSRYALRSDSSLHVDSVFQQSVMEGKTEWVNLLLSSEWVGKSSPKIALFLIKGVMEHPWLSAAVFRQIARYLSQQSGVDLNDRLTISEHLCYSALANAECPVAVSSVHGAPLNLERRQERVHRGGGDEYRITWSTQPLMMIVCAIPRSDLAESLLQDGLCSSIALLYQSAMERGETEKAARLLPYGGSCKVALSDAVRYGVSFSVLSDILRQYLRQGGSIYADLTYNGGGSILHQALFWERHDVVAYLLKEYPDKERYECGAQSSIRFLAATKNSPHFSSIADLPMNWLGKLKDIDQQEEQDLWDKLKKLLAETPYFKAAPYINEKDVNGNSPLGRMVWEWFHATEHLHRKQYVTYERNETYLRIYALLRLGADPNCLYREPRSNEEHTLVYYAAIMGNAPLVDLLASHGAPVLEAYLNKPLIRAVGIKPLLNTWYKVRNHRKYSGGAQ